jgi:thermostable 8-oxoguanine DNA glycosylase
VNTNEIALCAPASAESKEAGDSSGLYGSGPSVALEALGVSRTINWGQRWQSGTAAYWVATTDFSRAEGHLDKTGRHRLGSSLREEVAACILGGFGMPFELGLAAFHAVRERGFLGEGHSACGGEIEKILRGPLNVFGTTRKYRFPSQRADRLTRCLAFLDKGNLPSEPLQVRDWLLQAPGIGPKTASWIVRNHFDSDDVAILDIHVIRAGVAAGVFDSGWGVARNYQIMEAFFLEWARHGGVRASDLDATIWSEQSTTSRLRQRV